MPIDVQDVSWHSQEITDVSTRLQTDSGAGLSAAQVPARQARFGPNEVQAARRISPWGILLEQFQNVLIIILLIAAALSVFLGHGLESAAIAVIVLFAVLLGFVQEYRAERAIDALRQMAAPTAKVLRSGLEIEVPARDLVPGDLILLHAGDKVPADARLVQAVNLQVEEAALTGESVPVNKHVAVLADVQALGDRKNMVYSGTAITCGRGRALVVATGMQSEFGKIARMLETIETGRTPLQENLDRLGGVLARAAFVVVAIIAALGVARGQGLLDMLVFGIALAVAVVPEALPAVVTISLAIGVQRMVKRHALMRRLAAVETLGSTSVICSDKTGTLTRDEMTVRKIFAQGEEIDVTGVGYEPVGRFLHGGQELTPTPALVRLLQTAALASDAHIVQAEDGSPWRVQGDPTEGALVSAAAKAGLQKTALDAQYPRTDEICFTSESKRMTTFHTTPQGVIACVKGAPEIVLEACTRQQIGEAINPLGEADRAAIVAASRGMACGALRVLGVAARTDAHRNNVETDLVFLGLIGMIDPPRPEARDAIRTCEEAGIRPVMITGDHPLTAQAVATELGLLKRGRMITGAELEALDETEFDRDVEDISVYARVSPAHKLRVVTALQKKSHIVAMTGDGVNDAPALKKADIGIAMGLTGTDVTKEAAAMTLIDDNFASIVAAVEEGRGIFGNIKKYLMYLLSSNIGEIGLMAGATLADLPLPLTAVQILYVNLATDGLPALALAVDPPDPDVMHRKPRNPRSGIFTRPVVTLMAVGGVWSALVNLGLFAWAYSSGRTKEEAMTMTFVSLVLIQFFKAYNFRSDRRSVLHQPWANKWLNRAIAWELALLALVVYLPCLHEPFGTFSLPVVDWIIIVLLSATVSPVLELAKWMERRGWLGDLE